jgi:hypothetical protein
MASAPAIQMHSSSNDEACPSLSANCILPSSSWSLCQHVGFYSLCISSLSCTAPPRVALEAAMHTRGVPLHACSTSMRQSLHCVQQRVMQQHTCHRLCTLHWCA